MHESHEPVETECIDTTVDEQRRVTCFTTDPRPRRQTCYRMTLTHSDPVKHRTTSAC